MKAVYRVFKQLYDKGYIYRDNYMVNWDPGSHSAISDLEVENREVEDTLYSIDYPVEGSDRVLTVATVRPETMLADTAVAVNPDDERYGDLVGQHCVLPLVGRRLPIIADEHVDPEFGTGALKITPGHDPNDFEIGRKHGLEEIVAIGPDGRLTEEAGERFAGMTAAEAQEAVVAALREEGALRAEEPYAHSVPFSHRSGERIEPLISLQWFCRMDELAAPAIEAVESDRVRIAPGAVEARLPRLDAGDPPLVHLAPALVGAPDPGLVLRSPARRLSSPRTGGGAERCGACGGELRQEEDVLDTWFSSAIWPFATLGWPDDTPELRAFYPTSFLTTAREILFLWVARMIMTGLEFAGDVPFKDVYVHSVIQARDGRRMSKSLGTGIDPLEEIDVHGADALRFGLLAMSSTQDVRYSDAKVQQGRDLANKLWNASRLILLNARRGRGRGQSPTLRSRTAGSSRGWSGRSPRSREKLDAYDFAHAAQEAYAFFWSELCDWYLEIAKPRLYEGEAEVSANLLWVLERTLALLHPLMPFVTEEVWSYHPSPPGPPRRPPLPAGRRVALRRRGGGRGRARDRADPPPARLARHGRGARREPALGPGRGPSSRRSSSAASPASSSPRTAGTRSPRSARSRCSPRPRSTPRRSPRGSRSGARSCAPRSPAPRASSPTRSSSPRRRPSWSRRSAAKLERYRAELEELAE